MMPLPSRLLLAALLFLPGVASCLAPAAPPPERRTAAATVDVCSGIADGALCNDQNTCTTGDRCAAGLCVGNVVVDGTACTDGNQCTGGDLCAAGVCVGTPVPEGTLCTDGEPCTGPDTCQRGSCTAGPNVVCDDGLACTMDSCLLGTGCRFVTIPSCPPDAGAADALDASPADGAGAVEGGLPDANVAGDTAEGDATDGASTEGPDARPDDAVDGGEDAPEADGPVDGSQDRDGGPPDGDGGDGGSPDAGDGATDAMADGAADAIPVLLYQARGGACSCSATSHSPLASLTTIGMLTFLLWGRRPTRQRRQRRAR